MNYVNVYSTERCYGGAEEGGWWYTEGEPIECKGSFSDPSQAHDLATTLRNKILQPEKYHTGINDLDGCDPDGNGDDSYLTVGGAWGTGEITVLVQPHPPKYYPEQRPRYE